MKRKILISITPFLLITALTSCGGNTKEISELVVKTTLTPSTYPIDYEFDKKDLNVCVKYSDGTLSSTLNENEYTVAEELPYTFTKDDIDNGKEFTVSYLTKETKIKINVVPTLLDIEALPTKTEFISGETFDKSNLIVKALYKGGSDVVLEDDEYSVTPSIPYKFTDDDIGNKSFTISYAGKTDEISLTVKKAEKLVTSIEITNDPAKVKEGEELKLTSKVLPTDATLPTLDWSVENVSGKAEIVKKDDGAYLKGIKEGTVKVKASAIDGSGVTTSKDFDVLGLSSEEKFYNVYKKASDSFQSSYMLYTTGRIDYRDDNLEKSYSVSDITYKYKDSKTFEGRYAYITINSLSKNQDIAGGDNFTYYDDANKGIKSYISNLRKDGADVTFTSDETSGESSFSYKTTNTSGSYKFNSFGYLIGYTFKSSSPSKNDKITISYIGYPTDIQLTIDTEGDSARFLNPLVYAKSVKHERRYTNFKLEIKEAPTKGIVRVFVYDLRNPTKYKFNIDFKPGEIVQRIIGDCFFYYWTSIFVTCQYIEV